MTRQYLVSAESVSDGHPDKLADRISDTVLDAILAEDPDARVACETFIADGLVVVGGEVFSARKGLAQRLIRRLEATVRETLREVGYDGTFPGIDPDGCEVRIALNTQSAEIRAGVDRADGALGAGDQGVVFGYAAREAGTWMPLPIQYAHRIMEQHARVRRDGTLPWLRPDAKCQVTVRYIDGLPGGVEKVVLSTQHAAGFPQRMLRDAVIEHVIKPAIPQARIPEHIEYLVNPAGPFTVGGPAADAGLTGRKIVVDTYGGACPHGGGAFSGKDPTKVDRSAAYMARYVAKNIVHAELARRCTVQIAYAIGRAEPVSLHVDAHGTAAVDEEALEQAVREVFDLTPAGIIRDLNLRRPIYRLTSAFGHFGQQREEFTWERVDRASELRARLGLEDLATLNSRRCSQEVSSFKAAMDAGRLEGELLQKWLARY